ncbi:pyridoxal-dependent decarboxylase, exosortase A system-associated [Kangiella sp. TOML190]|uniref:pyridoxal-dependent decarboxylase, exosortase A system-associated n=1 Tax=Kangiella sp. TOML190 TaxID=2931351 RepID=UPI00203E80B5|nr:pyridoxal-dependent decarboxylase, exosortase A system-associated [Kangiella sp. TOML190]
MTKKKAIVHTAMDQFSSLDGELAVEGKTLSQIAQMAGQTPFYLYSKSVVRANIERLRKHFPKLSLHYAIKANPMPQLVSYVAELVDGLDVASGKELLLALATETSNDNISFAGPGKNLTELQMAIASGITINIESLTELERIVTLAQEQNTHANIAIRINPDFELKSSGMKMGGGSQQFGIDVEQLDPLFALLQNPSLRLTGLHIFTGSQNLNPNAIISAHNNIFALVERLQKQYQFSLEHLNIGGGFGIPYFPGDEHLALASIADNLDQLFEQYAKLVKNCEIILELGRYIVGNAGLYVAEVTDIKVSRGKKYLITNGGLHHHLAASGNFGQVIRKNYPVAIGNKIPSQNQNSDSEEVTIVGPLCTPLDLLGHKMLLPTAEIGDLVVIYQSGAYGFSASPRDFLSHQEPVELLL